MKFRWPISHSIKIDASVDKVWEVISAPGNINTCHPFCDDNQVISWGDENAYDILTYYNGRTLERKFFHWEPGKGYKLIIGRKGGRQTTVHWDIEPHADYSLLIITLFMPHSQNLLAIIRWFPYLFFLRPKMKSYLRSVVQGFEYHIRTGKAVSKNQFGSHPWFSP